MGPGPLLRLVRPTPPRYTWGVAVAVLVIVGETLLLYPLSAIETRTASAIYLIGVLFISMLWGLWLGVATAVVSALAYVFFHVQPVGRFAATDSRDWFQLTVFLAVAVLTSGLADLSRLRAIEAQESDLTAELARLVLNVDDVSLVLPAVAQRIARALGLPATAVEITNVADRPGPAQDVRGDARRLTFPLRDGGTSLGTLRVSATLSERQAQRLGQRVVPSLTALLRAASERTAMLNSLEDRGEALERLARQQAALRRVATLVARGVSPPEVFDTVTAEVGRLLDDRPAVLMRFEPEDVVTVVSTSRPQLSPPVGRGGRSAARSVAELVRRTGRAARIDDHVDTPGPPEAGERRPATRAAVGVPVVVEGRPWGAAAVTSVQPGSLPADAEARLKDFTDLVATAIVNADHRDQIIASRARIAAAADEERQRIERDLDVRGLQQLIAIGLKLRTATECGVAPEPMQKQLAQVSVDLNDVLDQMRDFARGIHPAILTTAGLKPALKALARRCPVPVDLHVGADLRLSAPVEVAAYHVVSQSLTNAAKHAHASVVHVDVERQQEALRIAIRDDGVGGADPDRGTGLTSLRDRVETLGGQMTITSPPGAGTSLLATIPITHR
ncbi:sensor histidine kinase [Dactylosporangium sp. CA-092794]|uniref:sensor histidine kinase n=1 Tax=Dactylosporangium sp. CA-092794 TaxID=3239929 RepID=UPI003D8A5D00